MDKSLSEQFDAVTFSNLIINFIKRGRKTGVLLGDKKDRSTAQKLLNYWSNELIHLDIPGNEWINSRLVDYDLDKAPELEEKDYPYLGLKVYEETDADLFFGRRNIIKTLLEKFKFQKHLVITGLRKSGKTSLVLAGLLPELKAGEIKESKNWYYLPFTKIETYLNNNFSTLSFEAIEQQRQKIVSLQQVIICEIIIHLIANCLYKLGLLFLQYYQTIKTLQERTNTIVLIIDQIEDIFLLDIEDKNRRSFSDNLQILAKDPNIKIILTMRQEFQKKFDKLYASLGHFFKDYQVEVTPFKSSELKEAIEIPAKRKGLQFESNITDRLVHELVGDPVPLPLLQFILRKLWQQRTKNLITEQTYNEVTGNSELFGENGAYWALSRTAHNVDKYFEKSSEKQEIIKMIFLQLFKQNLNKEIDIQRIQRKALYKGDTNNEEIDTVINKLSQENLIYLTQGILLQDSNYEQIEVVHSSLGNYWHRLKNWLEFQQLTGKDAIYFLQEAQRWREENKTSELLLRGQQIQQVKDLLNTSKKSKIPVISEKDADTLQEFVDVSRKKLPQLALGLFIGLAIGISGILVTEVVRRSNPNNDDNKALQLELEQKNEEIEQLINNNKSLLAEFNKTSEKLNQIINNFNNIKDARKQKEAGEIDESEYQKKVEEQLQEIEKIENLSEQNFNQVSVLVYSVIIVVIVISTGFIVLTYILPKYKEKFMNIVSLNSVKQSIEGSIKAVFVIPVNLSNVRTRDYLRAEIRAIIHVEINNFKQANRLLSEKGIITDEMVTYLFKDICDAAIRQVASTSDLEYLHIDRTEFSEEVRKVITFMSEGLPFNINGVFITSIDESQTYNPDNYFDLPSLPIRQNRRLETIEIEAKINRDIAEIKLKNEREQKELEGNYQSQIKKQEFYLKNDELELENNYKKRYKKLELENEQEEKILELEYQKYIKEIEKEFKIFELNIENDYKKHQQVLELEGIQLEIEIANKRKELELEKLGIEKQRIEAIEEITTMKTYNQLERVKLEAEIITTLADAEEIRYKGIPKTDLDRIIKLIRDEFIDKDNLSELKEILGTSTTPLKFEGGSHINMSDDSKLMLSTSGMSLMQTLIHKLSNNSNETQEQISNESLKEQELQEFDE